VLVSFAQGQFDESHRRLVLNLLEIPLLGDVMYREVMVGAVHRTVCHESEEGEKGTDVRLHDAPATIHPLIASSSVSAAGSASVARLSFGFLGHSGLAGPRPPQPRRR
jgi:hypothetical protein